MPKRTGITCPNCGATRLRTSKTRRGDGCRLRLKVCGCGLKLWTRECVALDDPADGVARALVGVAGVRNLLDAVESELRRSSGR